MKRVAPASGPPRSGQIEIDVFPGTAPPKAGSPSGPVECRLRSAFRAGAGSGWDLASLLAYFEAIAEAQCTASAITPSGHRARSLYRLRSSVGREVTDLADEGVRQAYRRTGIGEPGVPALIERYLAVRLANGVYERVSPGNPRLKLLRNSLDTLGRNLLRVATQGIRAAYEGCIESGWDAAAARRYREAIASAAKAYDCLDPEGGLAGAPPSAVPTRPGATRVRSSLRSSLLRNSTKVTTLLLRKL